MGARVESPEQAEVSARILREPSLAILDAAADLAHQRARRFSLDEVCNRVGIDARRVRALADERGIWVGGSGRGLSSIMNNLALAYTHPDFVYPSSPESKSRSLRQLDKTDKDWPVTNVYLGLPPDVATVCGGLGSSGMVSGPTVHLVDDCALTDRFLAENPFIARDFQWRVADYHRTVPEWYLDAIRKNDPSLMRDQLAGYRLAQLWEVIRPSPQ